MSKTIKTRSGRALILPTAAEDRAITNAALSDPDCPPLTDEEWQTVIPGVKRGRPLANITKDRITIRLSQAVVQQFRATGAGWQTRIDSALREWLSTHQ